MWNADNGVEALAIEDFAAGHVMSELDFCDGRTAARPDGRVARLYTYPRAMRSAVLMI